MPRPRGELGRLPKDGGLQVAQFDAGLRAEQPMTHLRNLVDYFVSRYLFIASSRFCKACPYSAKLPPC
jgi:hypothetical protein